MFVSIFARELVFPTQSSEKDRERGGNIWYFILCPPFPRPVLRSDSNVEQSPNQAELDAMAQYKYLRSFSEHSSDPQRLMDHIRAMPPTDGDQLIEQLQSRRTMASAFRSNGGKGRVSFGFLLFFIFYFKSVYILCFRLCFWFDWWNKIFVLLNKNKRNFPLVRWCLISILQIPRGL